MLKMYHQNSSKSDSRLIFHEEYESDNHLYMLI